MTESCVDCGTKFEKCIEISTFGSIGDIVQSLAKRNGFCKWICEWRFLDKKETEELEKKAQREEWLKEEARRRDEKKTFYSSGPWRALRYKILTKYGPKCMLCGAEKSKDIHIHVDHIRPISKFPHLALVERNLQVLCVDCNMGKSNIYEDDFRSI